MYLSIIIPARNEAAGVRTFLNALQPLRQAHNEIILVDGGSHDATREEARPLVDHLLVSAPGRALQMNNGARAATGDVLLFLHADTTLPPAADALIAAALGRRRLWGRFDVRLSGRQRLLRVVERLMNWRSCLSGIATGDQAIFVKRYLFEQMGGYAQIPLMEDIELSRRLKRLARRPACIHTPVVTSSRRWEENGILRTIWLMWRLRLAYFIGIDPTLLRHRYYGK